jgi:L-ribulose-5-phosphate 3-epimerase
MKRSAKTNEHPSLDRRHFLAAGAASVAGVAAIGAGSAAAAPAEETPIVRPPEGKRILLSCKLGMIPKKLDDKELSLVERLKMAGEAGFDGVDFDQAGEWTPE